jgi:predicted ATPase
MTKKSKRQPAAKSASAKGSAKRPKASGSKPSGRKQPSQPKPEGRKPFLERLILQNFLSFREADIELRNLNVLIGPNASGKSNLIEAVCLLHACPQDLSKVFATGGGFKEWLHKGPMKSDELKLAAHFASNQLPIGLVHSINMIPQGFSFEVASESALLNRQDGQRMLIEFANGRRVEFDVKGQAISNKPSTLGSSSMFRREKHLHRYLEETRTAYDRIQIHRNWAFGLANRVREPVPADTYSAELSDDFRNLALVLNAMQATPAFKRVIETMNELYPGIEDIRFQVQGGVVQMYIVEDGRPISAWRLSDGTLRFLTLLAILFQPDPPPLVCIEEPELGLHPDVQVVLAKLLVEASERMQLIVTTHSEMVISALSETPESVVVCDKEDGETKMTRLNAKELKEWLDEYRLGDLWMRGYIGGTRW